MSVRLFVGNLPYDTTETELRDFFSPVGPLATVIIPVDRDTGKRRGFAFVEFNDPVKAAEAGRMLNNQPFKGRSVTINEARARESRSDSSAAPLPAPRPTPRTGFTPAPKPSLDTQEFASDLLDSAKNTRAENRRRNFGADSKPAHKRKSQYGGKGEMGGRKGPIRERGGGQIFGGDGDDDYGDDSDYDYLADFRDSDGNEN